METMTTRERHWDENDIEKNLKNFCLYFSINLIETKKRFWGFRMREKFLLCKAAYVLSSSHDAENVIEYLVHDKLFCYYFE